MGNPQTKINAKGETMAARKKTADASVEPATKGRTKEFPRTVAFRVTELEYQGLQLMAQEAGLKVGHLMREEFELALVECRRRATAAIKKAESKAKREATKTAKSDAALTAELTKDGVIVYNGSVYPRTCHIESGKIMDGKRVMAVIDIERHRAYVPTTASTAAVRAGGRLD